MRTRLNAHTGLLLIDGSNVRATVGGRYSLLELVEACDAWAASSGLDGRVLTVWDHGPRPSSFALHHSVAAFSGNTSVQNADDVLVKSLAYLLSRAPRPSEVAVVTSDNGLTGRCHSQLYASNRGAQSSERHTLRIVQSIHFSWLFELDLVDRWQSAEELAARYAVPHSLKDERTRHRKAQAVRCFEALEREPQAGADSPALAPVLGAYAEWYELGMAGLRESQAQRSRSGGKSIYSLVMDETAREYR